MIVSRSDNLGDSWEPMIVRNARGKTGEEIENNRPVTALAVDTRTGDNDIVYVTYQRGRPGKTAPNAEPTRVYTQVSTDAGRTWGEPVEMTADAWKDDATRLKALEIAPTVTTVPPAGASTTTTTAPPEGSRAATPNQAVNFGGRNPTSAVDNKGTIYVIWHSATANVTPQPPVAYFMTMSSDQGKTWMTTQLTPFDRKNGFGSRLAWSPKGGAKGTLHWVSMGTDNPDIAGYGTVYYRQSTDGGMTWTDREMLPDLDPQDLRGQYIPNLAVAKNGRVDVAWWDARNDPGIRSNDVYYTYSEDNGTTWSRNIRVTDQSINRTYGVWGVNYDMSSPPGIAATDAFAVFGWDDTRASDPGRTDGASLGGGTSDMYSAAVQFAPVTSGASATARVVLAAVIGLLVLGVILLVVALVARRRSGAPPPAGRAATKAAAKV